MVEIPKIIIDNYRRKKDYLMTKKKVYRAGVIPYYLDGDNINMLFMIPSDPKFGGSSPQVSKGKREEGESDEETAFREASEELGLFKGNIIHSHLLGNFLGRTKVYVAKIKDPTMFGDPHFETKETKWLTPEKFQELGRGLHKPIVKAAVRYIEEKEQLN